MMMTQAKPSIGPTANLPRPMWILALLGARGTQSEFEPVQGSLRLMKELFLLGKTANLPDFYEFVPYRYGPCSFDVYRDLDWLKKEGLVQEVPTPGSPYPTFRVSNAGKDLAMLSFEMLPKDAKGAMVRVKATFNRASI